MIASMLLPALVALAGALIYAFATRGELKEIGRLSFFVGLFWTVYVLAQHKINI